MDIFSSGPGGSGQPLEGSLRRAERDLDRWSREIRRLVDSLVNVLFGINPRGGLIRWLAFTFAGGFAWALAALLSVPPTWPARNSLDLLAYPFQALFDWGLIIQVALMSILVLQAFRFAVIAMGERNRRLVLPLSMILILAVATTWAFLATRQNPPTWDSRFSRQVIEYPFRALFSALVFRHVVFAALVFWLAYRFAAIYLDDVFELEDVSIAGRFITQAAFAFQYPVVNIRDTVIAADQRSPVNLIGGPAYVRVFLENAALFEKIDGAPRVIGPTGSQNGGLALLDGFERLRSIVDLRSQSTDITVNSRTLDGIPVSAKDVRFIFSVLRPPAKTSIQVVGDDLQDPSTDGNTDGGRQERSDGSQDQGPVVYPFQEDAIRTLIYRQPKGPWVFAMRQQISSSLAEFISTHLLNEFLARVTPQELEERLQQEEELNADPVTVRLPVDSYFVQRDELTDFFYDFVRGFRQGTAGRGVSLEWVGIGRWQTPPDIVPEKHVRAWLLSRENAARRSPAALNMLCQESRLETILWLIRGELLKEYQRLLQENTEPDRIRRELTILYQSKLRDALDIYRREASDPVAEELIERVLNQLAQCTGIWM